MLSSENKVIVPTGEPEPAPNSPDSLPPWAAAVPLWASSNWLWLTTERPDAIFFWRGSLLDTPETGRVSEIAQLPTNIPYSLLVLDCRGKAALPDRWWPLFQSMLAPGGLMLICGLRAHISPGRLRVPMTNLSPGDLHLIEEDQEGSWHLRPAARTMRTVLFRLNPPYSSRVWLSRIVRRWIPSRRTIVCLPVWLEERVP